MSDTPEPPLNESEDDVHRSSQARLEGVTRDRGSKKSGGLMKWIVVGIVALFVMGTGIWFVNDNAKKRVVPDLVGQSYASAEALLKESGLGLTAKPAGLIEEVSGEYVEIVEQSFEAGSRIYEGSTIEVSVDPREVDVPHVVGSTFDQAEKDLAAAGLVLERVNAIPDDLDEVSKSVVLTWTVTDQSLDPAKKVDAGTRVVLSLDIPNVQVPELTSKAGAVTSLESAQSSFEASVTGELSRGLLQPVFTGKGYVPLSVTPAAGATVPAFTKVTVTLGMPMPDIVGEEIAVSEAVAKLEAMGFSNITQTNDDDTVVVGQNIGSGTVIAADASINLENKPKGYAYRVEGNGSVADITWSQPGGHGMQQANGESIPWEIVFDPAMSGRTYLSAFLSDDGSEITCQVIKDGVVIKENTSTGEYAMVSCD